MDEQYINPSNFNVAVPTIPTGTPQTGSVPTDTSGSQFVTATNTPAPTNPVAVITGKDAATEVTEKIKPALDQMTQEQKLQADFLKQTEAQKTEDAKNAKIEADKIEAQNKLSEQLGVASDALKNTTQTNTTSLPPGVTASGTNAAGKQQYTDSQGNIYVQNEYNAGTPQYRVDYTKISSAGTTGAGTTDSSKYILPPGSTVGGNGVVIDSMGRPLGDLTSFPLKPTEDSAAAAKLKSDQAREDNLVTMQNNLKQYINGTMALTPDQQLQVDNLKLQYEGLVKEQRVYNQNYEGGVTISGISSGRARYAPELAMGQLKAAQSSGLAKIADINSKMNSAVAEMRRGFQTDNYKLIKESYKLANEYQKEKSAELQKQIDDAATAEKDLRDFNQKIQEQKDEVLTSVVSANAPQEVKQAVQSAKTVSEAIQAAGTWLQTGTGDMGEWIQYRNAKMTSGDSYLGFSDWLEAKDAKASALKIKEAYSTAYASASGAAAGKASVEDKETTKTKQATEDIAKDKVKTINKLLTHSGLDSRVGPSRLGRRALAVGDKWGTGASFAGAVHQLASQEFLDKLIEAKSQGATFGALTDREGDALRAAATKINDWEVKDETGKGTGEWDVDEETFKTELNTMKELAIKSLGYDPSELSAEDVEEVNNILGVGGSGSAFDPASFYSNPNL